MIRKLLSLALVLSPVLANAQTITQLFPASGTTNVPTLTTLSWSTSGTGGNTYNVYVKTGTSGTLGPASFRGNQTGTSFWSGGLQPNTTYTWRVDVVSGTAVVASGTQRTFTTRAELGYIPRVKDMPDMPIVTGTGAFQIRDWKQVAYDFNELIRENTDTVWSDDYKPILQNDGITPNFLQGFTYVSSFVGYYGNWTAASDDAGMLGFITNVIGMTLSGSNMMNYSAYDEAKMAASYFSIDKDYGVAFHSVNGGPEQSMWYQLVSGLLLGQMTDLYTQGRCFTMQYDESTAPLISKATGTTSEYSLEETFKRTAIRWRDANDALKVPNGGEPYNYYTYHWNTVSSGSTGYAVSGTSNTDPDDDDANTNMPHTAAAIGWIEYMAHIRFGSGTNNFLDAAKDAIGALNDRPENKNPAHDILLPYGAITAARMDAEENFPSDTSKIMNWHFDTKYSYEARTGTTATHINNATGVAAGNGPDDGAAWGDYRVDGLVGKAGEPLRKVYPLNTFMSAGVLAPVARYDQRFAPSIGKWLLNVAYNSRLFYINAFDDLHGSDPEYQRTHQTSAAWGQYDEKSAMTYEFLGYTAYPITKATSGTATSGTGNGSIENVRYNDNTFLILTPSGSFSYQFTLDLPLADVHKLKIRGSVSNTNSTGMHFYYRPGTSGTWRLVSGTSPVMNVRETERSWNFANNMNLSGTVQIKAEGIATSGTLDSLLVQSFIYDGDGAPFLGGGHMAHAGRTNLCLYHASSVGYLGGTVRTIPAASGTQILLADLCKSDFFPKAPDAYTSASFPTFLIYNPSGTTQSVTVDVRDDIPGTTRRDIYDAVTRTFTATNAGQNPTVSIGAKETRVLVFIPTGLTTTRAGRLKKAGGTVIDYYSEGRIFADGFESANLTTGGWTGSGTTSPVVLTTANLEGNYGLKLAADATATKSLDTTGVDNLRVKYHVRTTTVETLAVEWSTTGTSWNPIETIVATGTTVDRWSDSLLPKAASDSPTFQLRFRNATSSGGNYTKVDSIEVAGTGKIPSVTN